MRLAALGVSYDRMEKTLGFAKSTLCKWLKQEDYKHPELAGAVLELDKVWTRVAGGNAELKVARDERSVALALAGSWEDALMVVCVDVPRRLGISSEAGIGR